MNQLRVSCDTKLRIPLDELHGIQGNLKSMTPENRVKFRNLILKDGISFSLHVWKQVESIDDKAVIKWWVIDGHGRVDLLREMREDGFTVPAIPCVEIEAADFRDAKTRVLSASSSFQHIEPDELNEFLRSMDLAPAVIYDYDLNVNVEPLVAIDEPEPKKKTVEFEASVGDNKSECPKCGYVY